MLAGLCILWVQNCSRTWFQRKKALSAYFTFGEFVGSMRVETRYPKSQFSWVKTAFGAWLFLHRVQSGLCA